MVTPVMTDTGHTYDLKNLQTWFQEKNTCPVTNEPTIIVARNLVCERIIEEWAKKVTDKGMEDVLTPAPAIVEPHTENDASLDDDEWGPEWEPARLWGHRYREWDNMVLRQRERELSFFGDIEASNRRRHIRVAVAGSDDDDW